MTFSSPKPPCEKIENKPGCIQNALKILGDKWSPLLLGQLVSGKKTFSELELVLAGISPRTLSQRLIKLEEENIIKKNMYNEHPPRFKYELTKKGSGLIEILKAMSQWGENYGEARHKHKI